MGQRARLAVAAAAVVLLSACSGGTDQASDSSMGQSGSNPSVEVSEAPAADGEFPGQPSGVDVNNQCPDDKPISIAVLIEPPGKMENKPQYFAMDGGKIKSGETGMRAYNEELRMYWHAGGPDVKVCAAFAHLDGKWVEQHPADITFFIKPGVDPQRSENIAGLYVLAYDPHMIYAGNSPPEG